MGFTFDCLLSSLLVTLISLCAQTRAKDALALGDRIADSETLISAGKVFELGFFSPGSSGNRYVGIWYYQFSTDTVLWVANRERPVRDANGSFAVGPDGNLIVLDGAKAVVWSSNASLQSNASTAQLQDTGNLELVNSGDTAWQSFDHPTDTYLPGMKVGLDLTTNVNQYMTSWKSKEDPAPGNFSLSMDPQRSTQIFMWEGTKPRWRSGRWNGQVFIGIQNMVPTYIYGFKLSNFEVEKKMYFYYTAFNSSHRYVLTWDGIVEHTVWKNDTSVWSPFWAQPVTDCEHYNKCGDNAACTDERTPKCACLKGFVPAAEDEWSGGNWTRGCVRRTALQCERNVSSGVAEADVFWRMDGIKLPDVSEWYSNVQSEDDCRAACASNCTCKAYAYPTGIGCLIWGADLVDIHVFSSGGNYMYLRLAGTELDKKKKIASFVIVIIVLGTVLLLAFIYLWWKCWRRKGELTEYLKRPKRQGTDDATRDHAVISYPESIHIANERNDAKCEELPLLSFDSIAAATTNFSDANLLGEGGFGPVYKGMLPGGQEIAVKRLSRRSGQGQEEFKNEVILIAKLQHRNLVRLFGCCVQKEERILVYEFMPNKSLDAFLFDSRKKMLLDWKTRFNIIEGIARGLVYLHRDSRLRIIHRDLKASNILLDNDMNPKISDFGMARIFGSDDKVTNTKRVVGTYGYMSPEYAMQGEFSVKSDVYSFGVLLLEIISGKKNSTYSDSELSLNLLGYAWKLWNEDNSLEFVDMAIRSSCSVREVSRCMNIGLLCVQDRPNDRPTMSSIVVMLESSTYATPVPRQPTFAAQRSHAETEYIIFDNKIASANNSITTLIGR